MLDHPMTERDPLILGNEPHEVLFNLLRVFLSGETQPLTDACDVGIHNHSRRDSISGSQDDVGCFSSHAGERDQIVHRGRNLPAVFFIQNSAAFPNISGLVPVKTGTLNVLFQFSQWHGRVVPGGAILFEEVFCHLIDAFIRALGGKYCRHQKLQGIGKIERAGGVRKLFLEYFQDSPNALRGTSSHCYPGSPWRGHCDSGSTPDPVLWVCKKALAEF